jgi:hypothetical protein
VAREFVTIPKEQFDKLCSDMCDVKAHLCGDPEFKIKGVLQEIQEFKAWRDSLAFKIAFLSGVVTTAGFFIKYFLTGKF